MRLFALLGLLLCGCLSAEKRAACITGDERLGLTPTGAVTADGFILTRSTTTGLFQTDAGVEFDVVLSAVSAVDPQGPACLNNASTVALTVTDPFTGVTATVDAVAP